jgi:hypothetical protein
VSIFEWMEDGVFVVEGGGNGNSSGPDKTGTGMAVRFLLPQNENRGLQAIFSRTAIWHKIVTVGRFVRVIPV